MLSRIVQHHGIANCLAEGVGAVRSLATTPDPALRSALNYCVNQVHTHDYENYVWAVQLPPELRASILTLRAFNVETALIADHARTEMLVLMRCQWWRDGINAAYKGTPPAQPVVTALADTIRRHSLTRYRLQRMVTTREGDLVTTDPPLSLQALEEYAEGTASQLLYLQLEAAGAGSGDAEHAASHLGKAVGMTGVLRDAVALAARGRSYLPVDICSAKGVEPHDVLTARPSEGIKDATLEVASAAKAHLEHARSFAKELPLVARQLMLPAVACSMYLMALEKANFDMFDPGLQPNRGVSPLAYQLRLKWHMLRGTY